MQNVILLYLKWPPFCKGKVIGGHLAVSADQTVLTKYALMDSQEELKQDFIIMNLLFQVCEDPISGANNVSANQ